MIIGMAGTGRMGAAIGLRLLEVGHQLVVWNRSADKLAPLLDPERGRPHHPATSLKPAETIVTILTNAEALAAVYDGPAGVLAADINGKQVIEMSTVQPADEIALSAKVRAKGDKSVECYPSAGQQDRHARSKSCRPRGR